MRKYTALSARSLACFLADARDPEAALCPHELVRPVESCPTLSFDQAEHTLSGRTSAVNPLANGHVAQKLVNGNRPKTVRRSSIQTASLGGDDNHASHTPSIERLSFRQPLQQAAKDPKSFIQALFDVLPVRLLEWMPPLPQRSPSHKYHHNSGRSSHGHGSESRKTSVYRKPLARGHGNEHIATRGKDGEDHRPAKVLRSNGSVKANGHAKEPTRTPQRRNSFTDTAVSNGEHGSELSSLPTSDEVEQASQAEESPQKQSDGSQINDAGDGLGSTTQQPSSTASGSETSLSVPTLTFLSTDILRELEDLHSKRKTDSSDSDSSDFFRQSLYYCLKDPCRLSACFETPASDGVESDAPPGPDQGTCCPKFNVRTISVNLSRMSVMCSWPEIFRNLSIAVHDLHIRATSRRPPHPAPSLSDRQAARVCVIGLYALSEFIQIATDNRNLALPELFDRVRAKGRVHSFKDEAADLESQPVLFPRPLSLRTYHRQSDIEAQNEHVLKLCDVFDDFIPLSLLENILGVVANRRTHWEISKTRANADLANLLAGKAPDMIQLILQYMADDAKQRLNVMAQFNTSMERGVRSYAFPDCLRTGFLSRLTLYWLRTLMLRDWDGRPSIRKSDTAGVILQILAAMYEKRCSIGLEPAEFWTPVFVQRFDAFDVPMEWLAFRPNNKTVHLLSYSFLFPPETVVNYFRAINYSRMLKSMEDPLLTKRAYDDFVRRCQIPMARRERLEQRLEIPGPWRFVIEVQRDNVLTDAMNQIWRRPRRDLLQPLKVRMEGEEGVDVGGVQQEMFRVLFEQALDPAYGMFTVDEETRMTWFQAESLEPLFKFEALGVLMSLAVYNSITLPITFPITFYRKLLGLKVKKIDHVRDGWPQLAENLQGLLEWKDGDVGEVHMRTYEFSYEAFGKILSIDIWKHSRDVPWPPGPSKKGKEKAKTTSFDVPTADTSEQSAEPALAPSVSWTDDPVTENGHEDERAEAPLVTNANREQYVKDYIFWLTDMSIRRQYEAFARGFYTCLDRTALSIFTAEALQSFVEGVQEIDIDGLQASTVYREYTADDQVVRWFWEVVKSWDHRRKKLLLEFATASDRVPVNGVRAIGFEIQKEGPVDERLPTSHTCFGTLLLPEYSSKEVLERMLGIAVEQAKGFGTI